MECCTTSFFNCCLASKINLVLLGAYIIANDPYFDPFCVWGNEIFMNQHQVRKLSAFWERGSPDLPACGPRRGCASRPVRPIFINKAFKTLARGQASRGRRRKTSSGAASPSWLARSGEIKAGQTSRSSRDVSHDDRDQAGARRAPVCAVSLFLVWC